MRISDWSSDVCSSDLIDFETKLFAKPSAPELLKKELAKKGYDVRPIAFGTNTDPFQPIEAKWKVARACMEVLAECSHPFTITTKSDRVTSRSEEHTTKLQSLMRNSYDVFCLKKKNR